MNNKRIFAFKVVAFSALLWGAMYLLDVFYSKTVAKNAYFKASWIIEQKGGNYDFAVVGNSRAIYTVDIHAIEKHSGLKGINLGTGASKLPENYLLLDRFLQKNNCKAVMMQLDIWVAKAIDLKDERTPYAICQFMPYIHEPDVDSLVRRYTAPEKYVILKYVPFARYAEFNTQYALFYANKKETSDMDDKGYEAVAKRMKSLQVPDSVLVSKRDPREIDAAMKENLACLNKMIALCKQKNVQLVFYTAPYHQVYNQYPIAAYSEEVFKNLSRKENIPYWNYSNMFWNRSDTLYSDVFHSNMYAADELGTTIADSLKVLFQTTNAPK